MCYNIMVDTICEVTNIALIGDGYVGKTSIFKSLQKTSYQQNTSPNVYNEMTLERCINDKRIVFKIIDTAGQEEYDILRKETYEKVGSPFLNYYACLQRDLSLSVFTAAVSNRRPQVCSANCRAFIKAVTVSLPMILVGCVEKRRELPFTLRRELPFNLLGFRWYESYLPRLQADMFLLCFCLADTVSYENVITKWMLDIQRYRSKPIILLGTKVDLRVTPSSKNISREKGIRLQKRIGAKVYVECSSKTGQGISNIVEAAVNILLTTEHKKSCSIQ
ncbi:hypothetical protein NQ318_018354 [Aromia moschata]|uniref:Uncharacterized protein n=1 Tax=Aromia moschata TaxID=1265417 RepID=A0AAV8ZGL3_9CUCU|nr:hypothetical protein NQ318_018354 [Aromia moschata]